jgi:hypothetical protein
VDTGPDGDPTAAAILADVGPLPDDVEPPRCRPATCVAEWAGRWLEHGGRSVTVDGKRHAAKIQVADSEQFGHTASVGGRRAGRRWCRRRPAFAGATV